jgi:hypothetical protein
MHVANDRHALWRCAAARDGSTPLARLELGTAADCFDRSARLAPKGDVVAVAEFEVNRLTEHLKAGEAGS